jgi:hypothetical protein
MAVIFLRIFGKRPLGILWPTLEGTIQIREMSARGMTEIIQQAQKMV